MTLVFGHDAYGQMLAICNGTGVLQSGGNGSYADASLAATILLYSGEQFDSRIGQQYLRARYYDATTGTFNRLDPFFGNLHNPQSFNKYTYVHGDPIQGIDPTGLEFTVGGLLSSIAIGGVIGGLAGSAVGAAHGAITGGLQGLIAGAWNGLLWGAAAGASIGAGGYALGTYFVSLGIPIVESFGMGVLVAGIPWRIAASLSLGEAIKSGNPVDIGFAALGFIAGYAPVTQGTQFNAFIGGYLRTLPFVKNFRMLTPRTANHGFSNTETWHVPFASFRWAAEFTTSKPIRFIRMMKQGQSKREGGWVVLESEVVGKTGEAIQQHLAIDFVPDAYQVVEIPAQVTLRSGQVGPQPTLPNAPAANGNGGLQFQIFQDIPSTAFGEPVSFQGAFKGTGK